MPHEVVIGLGSNIDPEANLEQAVKELKSRFKVSKRSQWTRTKPIGIQDQPDFYNGALLMETELEQQSLKQELKQIEESWEEIEVSQSSVHVRSIWIF